MDQSAKIFVDGHRGLVGSAIVGALRNAGYDNLVLKTRSEVDLTSANSVNGFFQAEKPQHVIIAAAKVGGIMANATYPVEFLEQNLAIQQNIMRGAYENDVEKLLFLGSSCIYPKFAPQPIKEEYLLTGVLEPTNEAYAIAKIAGIRLAQSYYKEYGKRFICAMPTNMYGNNDNFDLATSHVLPALIRRFHVAKTTGASSVTIWGTGTPRREFLHAADLGEACVFLMNNYEDSEHINVGTGTDVTIAELAGLIADIVGYKGEILFDTTKPDGTPRKLMDVSKLNALGWREKISLDAGIKSVYDYVDKSAW